MARGNVALLAFNRGIISDLALARLDVERVRLSASLQTNWISKTQGAMRLRPGLKHLGNSINDTGATWIDFVASTDDIAALEMTHQKMRVWIDDALLEHNTDTGINTTIANLTDSGSWIHNNSGGAGGDTGAPTADLVPKMTGSTTSGVTVTGDAEHKAAWYAFDDDNSTVWQDVAGPSGSGLPSWIQVDFGSGNAKAVRKYTIRCGDWAAYIDNMPKTWTLQGRDTGAWTTEDTQGSESGWSISEKREYTAQNDTGSTAYRFWRLNISALNGDGETVVGEIELFGAGGAVGSTEQINFVGGKAILNAKSRGSVASVYQLVTCDTGNQEIAHAIKITIDRGPIRFRCGSSIGSDDYITETTLRTGVHHLEFTPSSDFYLVFYTNETVDRIIGGVEMADTGTVEIDAPWEIADMDNLRWAQSADVLFLACDGYQQRRIERRGTGRSWSIVKYETNDGPFFATAAAQGVRLKVDDSFGNTVMTSSQEFFSPDHIGALFRLRTDNFSWTFDLGDDSAFTDPITVTGVTGSDTGQVDDRSFSYTVAGTWSGTLNLLHSIEDKDNGPYTVTTRDNSTTEDITSNATYTKNDREELAVNNNLIEWFKVGFLPGNWTSGVATVTINYNGGGETGIVRVTGYRSPTEVDVEVIESPSTADYTDNWQEGVWSNYQGWPSEVALYEGRLWWLGRAYARGSVPDDFTNFDDRTIGDGAPINRTIGDGPIDDIIATIPLTRLLAGTAGGILSFRSSTLDEPLTVENMSAKIASTQGAANLRMARIDARGVYVGRSKTKAFELYYDINANDYISHELTVIAPNILDGQLLTGVVDIITQRQPDTRIHFVLTDGTVRILTYEPQEELLCWSSFKTDGSVEGGFSLPGIEEDQVYYHVNRTIDGSTKRFLEKWAKESQTEGDTGNALADSYLTCTDTGSTLTVPHLEGETVCVWRNKLDRGEFTVTGGVISNVPGSGDAVVGLPYKAHYRSTKLAYAAQSGTALLQPKRVDRIGLILSNTYHTGIQYGGDSGHIDYLPEMMGATHTDTGQQWTTFDEMSFPFNGDWDTDARIYLRAQSPRPCTVVACVLSISTKDNI